MPYHLLLARYSDATWERITSNPENRMVASREGARDFNGEMLGYWYSTGRYDVYSLQKAPDLVTASALHATLFSSGAFAAFDHSVLLDVEEMREAMQKTQDWPSLKNYQPPGAIKSGTS